MLRLPVAPRGGDRPSLLQAGDKLSILQTGRFGNSEAAPGFARPTLFELGWEHVFEGEIVGLIGSGLFARFGEVFEGYLPARRLPGDYFELNPLGTALLGRRGGRRYKLGDPIKVHVEEIRRAEGKVELSLADDPRS